MRKVIKSAFALSVVAFLMRFLGPLKAMLIADRFGVSRELDAYFLSQTLVDVFIASVGSAMIITGVPALIRANAETGEDRDALKRAVHGFTGQTVLLGLLLATAFMVLAGPLAALVPGFDDAAERRHLAHFIRILSTTVLLSIPFTAMSAFFHSRKRVVLPSFLAAMPIVFSLLSVLLLAKPIGAYCLPVGMAVGHAVALAWLLAVHVRQWGGFTFRVGDISVLRRISPLLLPALIFSAGGQVDLLVDKLVVSRLADGAVSVLSYGQYLYMVPFALVTLPLVTAIFPEVSSRDIHRGQGEVTEVTVKGFLLLAALLVPVSLLLALLRTPVIAVLYGHGRFGAASVAETAGVVLAYAPGIVFLGLNSMIQRVFFARRAMYVLMVLAFFSCVLNAVLDIAFARVLGVQGVALATSVVGAVYFCLITVVLRRRLGIELWHGVWRELVRLLRGQAG